MDYYLPNPPQRFMRNDIDEILIHCEKLGFSDLHIQTNTPLMADIHGRKRRLMDRPLMAAEVNDFIIHINGEASLAQLANVIPLNPSYDIKPERGVRYRYRVNAVGVMVDGREGIKITIRAINPTPPSLEFLNLPQEVIDNFFPSQGIVLVTGATGSGKSTLLAGMVADALGKPESDLVITTAESPIEYVYDAIDKPSSLISQSEVPRHLPTFEAAIENAMRQAIDIILVGEMRDPGSIGAAVMAAQTGHLVLSTAHTNGVAETVRRLVNVFPGDEQKMRQSDIIEVLRMVVTQRLLPTVDGKRTPVREYHIFNEIDRVELLNCSPTELAGVMRRILNERGRPIMVDLKEKLEQGIISQETFDTVRRGSGG